MKGTKREGTIPVKGVVLLAVVVLLAAGAVLYAKLAKPQADQAQDTSAVPSFTVESQNFERTIRVSGVVAAERFLTILTPQLSGNRNSTGPRNAAGGSSSSSGSSSTSSSSTSSTSSSSSSSAPSSSSGAASGSSSSSSTSSTGPKSSLGALRGTQNRFGDRTAAAKSGSTSGTSAGTSNSSGSSTSGLGSTSNNLLTSSQRGSGGGGGGGNNGGDFQLVLMKVVAPGARVRKGEIIAEFDRQAQLTRLDDYKASVVQYEGNITKLQADLATAKNAHDELIRSSKATLDKALLDLKTAEVRSAIEAEELKIALDEAQASYKQVLSEVKLFNESQRSQLRLAEIARNLSKIELDRVTRNIDRMVIKAPMDGVAVMKDIFRGGDFGQVQQGDQLWPGQPFMQVIDPSLMIVNGTVNQVDSQTIQLGRKAKVRLDAYPGLEFEAHVTGIGAMTKPGVWRPQYMREVPVRLQIDAHDGRIIPDISASADVLEHSANGATAIPLEAVFTDQDKPFVFVRSASGSGWEKRDVALSDRSHITAVIRSGVQPGDVIALRRPDERSGADGQTTR